MTQREIADRMREILNRRYPGVEFLQWPGGLVASVFSNGYIAPLVVEVRGDNLEELDEQAQGGRRGRASGRRHPRRLSVAADRLPRGPRRDRSRDRRARRRQRARRRADDARGDARQHQHAERLDRSEQRAVVLRRHLVRRARPSATRMRLARIPVRVRTMARPSRSAPTATSARSVGPIAIERNQLQRVAHVLMQTEGRDIGSAADELERRLARDPRTRDVQFDFVGQVELMRTTFSGLGVAIGLAVMVVFMIMASQFKSLRLPFVMLFTIPVSLVGIVMALMAAGQGFSITALMGMLMVIGIAVSNGILLVDDAATACNAGMDKVERSCPRRASASSRSR